MYQERLDRQGRPLGTARRHPRLLLARRYGPAYNVYGLIYMELAEDKLAEENFRRAITPRTRLLYAETLGNPLLNIVDIEAVAAIAQLPMVLTAKAGSPFRTADTRGPTSPVPAPAASRASAAASTKAKFTLSLDARLR